MTMSSQMIGPQSLDKLLQEIREDYMSQSLITQAEINHVYNYIFI